MRPIGALEATAGCGCGRSFSGLEAEPSRAPAGSTPALTAITLDATPSDFEFLWDWEDRCCNVIEHARSLPPWQRGYRMDRCKVPRLRDSVVRRSSLSNKPVIRSNGLVLITPPSQLV